MTISFKDRVVNLSSFGNEENGYGFRKTLVDPFNLVTPLYIYLL